DASKADMPDKLLQPKEAAAIVGINVQGFYELCRRGTVPCPNRPADKNLILRTRKMESRAEDLPYLEPITPPTRFSLHSEERANDHGLKLISGVAVESHVFNSFQPMRLPVSGIIELECCGSVE